LNGRIGKFPCNFCEIISVEDINYSNNESPSYDEAVTILNQLDKELSLEFALEEAANDVPSPPYEDAVLALQEINDFVPLAAEHTLLHNLIQ
jgi:hypothetical protein